jgi:2,3-bisphosphoglycerate-independent phosphoglycerate mutase
VEYGLYGKVLKMKKPFVLCILDGWGEGEPSVSNAIYLAQTPTWDALTNQFPKALLSASGVDVGLPAGQMGNSEVGHMTIGAGRVVLQDLPRIDHAIAVGEWMRPHPLLDGLAQKGGICHVMGLLSPGGVHSHQEHIIALCRALAQRGVSVAVHAFLDGRDTPPQSAKPSVTHFLEAIQGLTNISLASIGGRYYGMDRDQRWERIQKAYTAFVHGNAPRFQDPLAYIQHSYDQGITDEFIIPAIAESYTGMKDGDSLIALNFRADRMRQILRALLFKSFEGFDRGGPVPHFSEAIGLVNYAEDLDLLMYPLFPSHKISQTLGEVLAEEKLTQLRVAETEKYAHVTYFLNGGREKPYAHEDRILVPSLKVATYDLVPEMSAHEVTDRVCTGVEAGHYDLIVVNYANADMVGHSGDMRAAVKAVEYLDGCLLRLWEKVQERDGILVITADHGNVEKMVESTNGHHAHTAHTLNLVPFVVCQEKQSFSLKPRGSLADVAPTILVLMKIPQPVEMSGVSLVKLLS